MGIQLQKALMKHLLLSFCICAVEVQTVFDASATWTYAVYLIQINSASNASDGLLCLSIWPQQNAEDLLSSPQLQGLQEGWSGQVDLVQGATHGRAQLRKLAPAERLLFACQQIESHEKVLHK